MVNARGIYHGAHLVNKYSESDLAAALGDSKFDWVVDVNLFSYACCWGHAMRYLWRLDGYLAEGGSIVSHAAGTTYAPTGFILTPFVLEQLTRIAGMRATTHPNGLILIAKGAARPETDCDHRCDP